MPLETKMGHPCTSATQPRRRGCERECARYKQGDIEHCCREETRADLYRVPLQISRRRQNPDSIRRGLSTRPRLSAAAAILSHFIIGMQLFEDHRNFGIWTDPEIPRDIWRDCGADLRGVECWGVGRANGPCGEVPDQSEQNGVSLEVMYR